MKVLKEKKSEETNQKKAIPINKMEIEKEHDCLTCNGNCRNKKVQPVHASHEKDIDF